MTWWLRPVIGRATSANVTGSPHEFPSSDDSLSVRGVRRGGVEGLCVRTSVPSFILKRLCDAAAARMAYEEAAVYRDQVAALRKVREKQYVSDESVRDADIIACERVSGITCVNLAMVRGGRHLGDKNFYPRNAEDSDAAQILEAFISQHYLQHGAPPLIIAGAPLAADGCAPGPARLRDAPCPTGRGSCADASHDLASFDASGCIPDPPRMVECRLMEPAQRVSTLGPRQRLTGRLVGWLIFVLALTALGYASRLSDGETPDDVAYRYSSSVAALVQYGIMLGILLLIARGLPKREAFALRRPDSWRRAVGLAALALLAIWIASAALAPFLDASDEQGLVPEGWDCVVAGGWVVSSAEVAGVVLLACCAAGVTVASGVLVPHAVSTAVRPRLPARRSAVPRRFVMGFIIGSSRVAVGSTGSAPACDMAAEATLKPTPLGFSRPSGSA